MYATSVDEFRSSPDQMEVSISTCKTQVAGIEPFSAKRPSASFRVSKIMPRLKLPSPSNGPDFTIGWDSHAADFAMTLGEFYCKGLTAPVMVEIKRDDVVFARVYDIRGRSISSLLAIPAP